jgi:hypothetical protein
MLLDKYFKKYLFFNYNSNNTTEFDDEKYYKSVYDTNLFYINLCEKYDIFHNVKDFLYSKYINNTFFIEKINYNNNYFNSLNVNDTFDI